MASHHRLASAQPNLQEILLCKFIYVNLRTTVHLEEETGYVMDYLIPERRFPRPTEPLLNRAA